MNSRNQATEKVPSNSPTYKHGNGKDPYSIGAYNIVTVIIIFSDVGLLWYFTKLQSLDAIPSLFFKPFLFVATSYSKTNVQTSRNTVPPPGHQINGVQPSSFFDSWHAEVGKSFTAPFKWNPRVGHIKFKHLLSQKKNPKTLNWLIPTSSAKTSQIIAVFIYDISSTNISPLKSWHFFVPKRKETTLPTMIFHYNLTKTPSSFLRIFSWSLCLRYILYSLTVNCFYPGTLCSSRHSTVSSNPWSTMHGSTSAALWTTKARTTAVWPVGFDLQHQLLEKSSQVSKVDRIIHLGDVRSPWSWTSY